MNIMSVKLKDFIYSWNQMRLKSKKLIINIYQYKNKYVKIPMYNKKSEEKIMTNKSVKEIKEIVDNLEIDKYLEYIELIF